MTLFFVTGTSTAAPLFELGEPIDDAENKYAAHWVQRVDVIGDRDLRAVEHISLPRVADRPLELSRRQVVKTRLGNYLWHGSVDGLYNETSFALIAFDGETLSGFIQTRKPNNSGPQMYELRPQADGHLFIKSDGGKFEPCGGAEEPDEAASKQPPVQRSPMDAQRLLTDEEFASLPRHTAGLLTEVDRTFGVVQEISTFPRANEVIDVMLVYTNQAVTNIGASGLQNHATASIGLANASYSNSQITQRFQLVYADSINYDDSLDSGDDLTRLGTQGDGFMDSVHNLRDSVGADMVASIHEDLGDACGRGYLLTQRNPFPEGTAFNVTDLDCISNHTLTHEFGHNQGFAHDRANAGVQGYFTFSYGLQRPNQGYRTILAYSCDGVFCGREPYLSNPQVSFNGVTTGISSSQSDSADNALTFQTTAPIIEAYRDPTINTPVPTPSPTATRSPALTPTPVSAINAPFRETFDSSAVCDNDCGRSCSTGSPFLQNVTGSNNWIVWENATASDMTGPSFDNTSGFGRFIYTEASFGCSNIEYVITTRDIDLSAFNSPGLRFASHMYGGDMGTLSVELFDSRGFFLSTLFTDSRNVNQWQTHTIDLNTFKANAANVFIVFRGTTGNNFESDMAIDDIELFDAPIVTATPTPAPTTPTPTGTPSRPLGDVCDELFETVNGSLRLVGSTVGMRDDYAGSCGGDSGPDIVYRLSIVQSGRYVVRTDSDYDALIYMAEVCGGSSTGCNDDFIDTSNSRFEADLIAGREYYLHIDAFNSDSGNFDLNVALRVPVATSTPAPATATPTPSPTRTPTPIPTFPPTSTPRPSATPARTNTPIPTFPPTSTPIPSATPEPTATPTRQPTVQPTPTQAATDLCVEFISSFNAANAELNLGYRYYNRGTAAADVVVYSIFEVLGQLYWVPSYDSLSAPNANADPLVGVTTLNPGFDSGEVRLFNAVFTPDVLSNLPPDLLIQWYAGMIDLSDTSDFTCPLAVYDVTLPGTLGTR